MPELERAELVRRTKALVRELGLELGPERPTAREWTAFLSEGDRQFELCIGPDLARLRIEAGFSFPPAYADWLADRMADVQDLCHARGQSHWLGSEDGQIRLLVAGTLYFSGIQYYAFKEALADLVQTVDDLRLLLHPGTRTVEGGQHGNP